MKCIRSSTCVGGLLGQWGQLSGLLYQRDSVEVVSPEVMLADPRNNPGS